MSLKHDSSFFKVKRMPTWFEYNCVYFFFTHLVQNVNKIINFEPG